MLGFPSYFACGQGTPVGEIGSVTTDPWYNPPQSPSLPVRVALGTQFGSAMLTRQLTDRLGDWGDGDCGQIVAHRPKSELAENWSLCIYAKKNTKTEKKQCMASRFMLCETVIWAERKWLNNVNCLAFNISSTVAVWATRLTLSSLCSNIPAFLLSSCNQTPGFRHVTFECEDQSADISCWIVYAELVGNRTTLQ